MMSLGYLHPFYPQFHLGVHSKPGSCKVHSETQSCHDADPGEGTESLPDGKATASETRRSYNKGHDEDACSPCVFFPTPRVMALQFLVVQESTSCPKDLYCI